MDTVNIAIASGAASGEGRLFADSTKWDTWANARGGANVGLTNPTDEFAYYLGYSGGQYVLSRYFFKVDYSVIPVGAKIYTVTFNFKARYNTDNSTAIENMDLVKGNQGATLDTGDWGGFGTTPWAALTGTIEDNTTSKARTLALNATGVAAVTPGQTLDYCFMHYNDLTNAEPGTGNNGPIMYLASATTEGNRPTMTVTYESPTALDLTSKLW